MSAATTPATTTPAAHPAKPPRLLALSLGGTITMTATAGGGIAPTLGAADLVAAVPGLGEVADIEARSPFRLGSSSLTLANIAAVAAEIRAAFAEGFDAALVIQGTDTIEETAFALDLLVGDERPVVVIGAMRGPQQPGADGPANLLAGALVAVSAEARGMGTLVVLNDEIHAARYVRKAHTALTSAFVSANGGPLGLVAEGRARFFSRVAPPAVPVLLPGAGELPPVALVKIGMGDDGRLLPALAGLGYAGAVIEGAGAGHVPGVMAEAVGELAAQMPVVLASRTLGGPVFERSYGYPGSEIDLIARGAIPAGLLPALKARLLLVLALKAGFSRERIAAALAAFG
ncbi:asparaginase [Ancylobacter defluvii]|uniref:L-asparaginase n=1 Tax=Ancylobacter defluvii TaxID=1282440 RepID=A0A9W6JSX5_9HYPH|nr:asparaginase [Ancylobacter defluvii]MBS7590306.1 asparaginase [Ancylobacter defluvii]GLK83220.1 L-asparaginase [Ancylobacter defluvii]